MNYKRGRKLYAAVLIWLMAGGWVWSGARLPFPQHVEYGEGRIIPSLDRRTMDEDVRNYYTEWKRNYLVREGSDDAGHPLYRIAMGSPGEALHDTTVSEGQGYGMMIVAWMAGADPDARSIFDGLWRFSRLHPSKIDGDLMSWRYRTDDPQRREDSAFDGDADIAYALLLADRQWGSRDGIRYRAEARRVMAAIMRSTIGPQSHLPMLGDWVDPDAERYNQYTVRSSDLMPLWFDTFAQLDSGKEWRKVTRASLAALERLQERFAAQTGLVPDFFVPESTKNPHPRPAPENFLEGPNDGAYYYNACRVALRIGWDALWSGRERSRAIVQRLNRWVRKETQGHPRDFRAGYTLDGTPLEGSDYVSGAFLAPLGVAAMNDPAHRTWLDRIYRTVRRRHQGYYEDSLILLSLLTMSGNFWSPFAPPRTLYPAARRLRRGSLDAAGLGALRRNDQHGSDDDPGRYMRLRPDAEGRFRIRFRFAGGAAARMCRRSLLLINTRSASREVDRWHVAAWDPRKERYRPRLENGDKAGVWTYARRSLGPYGGWSDAGGEMRIVFWGESLEDVLDLDYLAVRLERCVWSGAPAESSPSKADTTGGPRRGQKGR